MAIINSSTEVREMYPNVQIENQQGFYSLSDLFNIQSGLKLQKELLFEKSKILVLITPENYQKLPYIENSLSYINTGQKHPDKYIKNEHENYGSFYDEKKGHYKVLKGHIHYVNDTKIERESHLFLTAQFTALKALNVEYKNKFEFLLKEIQPIFDRKSINWAEKNIIIQKILYRYTSLLPQNKVPSLLIESSHSYEIKEILNNRSVYNTPANVDSFSTIDKTNQVLALGVINQGTKATKNFIESLLAILRSNK